MTDDVRNAETGVAQERHYSPESAILIAADEKSHRHYFHTPSGGVLSTPARDVEEARKRAADEYPDHGVEDFELITNLCRHGMPREAYSGCWSCTKEKLKRKQIAFKWFFGEVLP